MECKVCGRTSINESANFCDYCGASFREGVEYYPEHKQDVAQKQNEEVKTPGIMDAFSGSSEKPMSFGNWMALFALLFIPYIGALIFIVLIFIWAFGSQTAPTKKNFARALLVVLLVGILLTIVMFVVFFSTIADPAAWLENYTNLMKTY